MAGVMQSFSVWHWAVIAIILLLLLLAVWLIWRSAKANRGGPPLTGFQGWLLLLAIGVYLSPLRTLVNMSKVQEGVSPDVLEKFRLLFNGEIALNLVLFILQTVTAVFMARKSRKFAMMFICTGIFIVLMTPLDIVWSGSIISNQTNRSFQDSVQVVSTPEAIGGWIGACLAVAVWMLYVTRSRRVANTFVR